MSDRSVVLGKAPPSRLMASWILVSLVSRASAALRTGGDVEPISETGSLGIEKMNIYYSIELTTYLHQVDIAIE